MFDQVCFLLFGLHLHDAGQSFEIVGHRFERQFQLVTGQAQVTHLSVELPFFKMRKDALDVATHSSLALIVASIPGSEFDVIGTFLFDAFLIRRLRIQALLARVS